MRLFEMIFPQPLINNGNGVSVMTRNVFSGGGEEIPYHTQSPVVDNPFEAAFDSMLAPAVVLSPNGVVPGFRDGATPHFADPGPLGEHFDVNYYIAGPN